MITLFDKLSGKDSVDRFYERVLNDKRIKHFFEHIDMNKQRGHQKAFLTYAFGGALNTRESRCEKPIDI